jgi:hypothetical protein
LRALRSHHPGKPSGFNVKRGATGFHGEYYGVPRRQGIHETQYFADPFEAPAWRRQWVQQPESGKL